MSLRVRDVAFARVFGANLARARNQLGISQEELGFRAGLHRTAVGQLERGERVARSDTLVRLCFSLGVGPDDLLAGLRWRPTQIAEGALEIEEIEPEKTSQAKREKRSERGPKRRASQRLRRKPMSYLKNPEKKADRARKTKAREEAKQHDEPESGHRKARGQKLGDFSLRSCAQPIPFV